jgi:hypothetical protein
VVGTWSAERGERAAGRAVDGGLATYELVEASQALLRIYCTTPFFFPSKKERRPIIEINTDLKKGFFFSPFFFWVGDCPPSFLFSFFFFLLTFSRRKKEKSFFQRQSRWVGGFALPSLGIGGKRKRIERKKESRKCKSERKEREERKGREREIVSVTQ